MLASIPLIALLVSSASALVLPRHRALARAPTAIEVAPRAEASQPADWTSHHLEDYETYHIRYMALDCEDKHNTTFWDACCHPRAASNTTALAAECTPSKAALASASARYGEDDCEETSSAPAPTPTETEECGGEETSSVKPTPKPTSSKASSTKKAATTKAAASPDAAGGAGALGAGPTTTAKPSSSKAEPTSSKTSSTKTSAAAQPTGSVYSGGVATYFLQDGTAGACGAVHPDSALIAAIDQDRYGNSDAESSLCGKQVRVTNTSNKKTVVVTIADDCPTCKNANSIDLSKSAFTQIATIEEGEVDTASPRARALSPPVHWAILFLFFFVDVDTVPVHALWDSLLQGEFKVARYAEDRPARRIGRSRFGYVFLTTTTMQAARKILVVGGNGFIGSAVCKAALARGMDVTSISSSGAPYRTPAGHTPAWAAHVNWQKADALAPASYAHLLPAVDGVVHTLGTLLPEPAAYKAAVRSGSPGALVGALMKSLGGGGNPLEQGGGYERLNRDAALRVCEAFVAAPREDAGDRAFVYISAEDIFRPVVPARYIETKREAELGIQARVRAAPGVRGVFIRPSLVYHPHLRPLTSPLAALLDASASLHAAAPPAFPTPAALLRLLGGAGTSVANALSVPPIHVAHVADAVCAALDPARGVSGVVGVRAMRELIGWADNGKGEAAAA
ncbi:hypothetical protein HWV62_5919 [Athelia sp. TMB]|nr:hypothetical protein HWV62_5919 [Athelia sp. TMB]